MGEIVALCAVEEIVGTFYLRVAMLLNGLDQVFQSCSSMSLLHLRDCCFVVTASNGSVIKLTNLDGLPSAAVKIPCESFSDQVLRVTFQNPDEEYQKILPFSLASINRGSA